MRETTKLQASCIDAILDLDQYSDTTLHHRGREFTLEKSSEGYYLIGPYDKVQRIDGQLSHHDLLLALIEALDDA